MATTYDIHRLEQGKDSDGADEVFVQLEIFDDTLGMYNFGKWLNTAELEIYLNDKTQIDTIVQKWLPAARIQHQISLAYTAAQLNTTVDALVNPVKPPTIN